MDVETKTAQDASRMKMIKAMILSACAATAAGSLVRTFKARSDQKKRDDAENSRNAIVVHIDKDRFMSGLPTPDEYKKEMESKSKKPSAPSPDITGPSMSSLKRDILKRNGRKLDFMTRGKQAEDDSDSNADAGSGNDIDASAEADTAAASDGPTDGGGGHDGDKPVLRDSMGRFASPTDPVAVEKAEKSAETKITGLKEIFTDPQGSLDVFINAVKKPAVLTAGALGSWYLATKLTDVINKNRAKKSKRKLEYAVDEYVRKVEAENEKLAEVDIREIPGYAVGASLAVPFAVTWLITKQIYENRRDEKKKRKDKTNSFPQDTSILYKVSEDETINISPEVALASIAVRADMMRFAEIMGAQSMHKSADDDSPFDFSSIAEYAKRYGEEALPLFKEIGSHMAKHMPTSGFMDEGEAYNNAMSMLENGDNSGYLLNMVKGFGSDKGIDGIDQLGTLRDFWNMSSSLSPMDRSRFIGALMNPGTKNGMIKNMVTGSRMQNLVTKRLNDDKDIGFRQFREGKVNDYLGKYLNKGSVLYNIFSWIINNLGIGKYMASNYANNMFSEARKRYQPTQQTQPPVQQAATTAQPVKPPAGAPHPMATAQGNTSNNVTARTPNGFGWLKKVLG